MYYDVVVKRALLIFGLIVTYILLVSKFMDIYFADVYAQASKKQLEELDVKKAHRFINRAISQNPSESAYLRQRAKVRLAKLATLEGNLLADEKQDILDDLERARFLNPKNLSTLRNSVPLYYFLSMADMTEPASPENVDVQYLGFTRDLYSGLKKSYGNDLGVIAEIAKYEKKLFLVEEYDLSVEMVKGLRPELLDWHESFQ